MLLLGLCACHGGGAGVPNVANAPVSASNDGLAAKHAAASTQTDWDSWGYDLQRTGYNPNESTVGIGNVGSLVKLWSINIGKHPMPELVLASGVAINGLATNVLYAGSNVGSTMYAINAQTGAIIWSHAVPSATATCQGGKLLPWSIGATPAIDRGKNLIYFGDGQDNVHALNLATGSEASGFPINIASFPTHNHMHGGLTYNPANGLVYAETSSMCGDISPWYGRIVAINTNKHTIPGKFFPVSGTSKQGGSGGGVWGGGGGSIDPKTNDVLIATGNADTKTGLVQNAGYAENFVMLSPWLGGVVQFNYPGNIPSNEGDDFDFGSTPTIFTPPGCPEMAAALNKSGMFELYDVASIGTGPVQFVAMSLPSSGGDFQGSPAYDPVTNELYIGLPDTYSIYLPGVAAFSIQSNCTINPTPVWNASFGPDGSTTTGEVSRSAVTIANGVVFVGNNTGNKVFAFNAATGAKLWSTSTLDGARTGTIVVNGIVYVAGGDGTITAWAPPGTAAKR